MMRYRLQITFGILAVFLLSACGKSLGEETPTVTATQTPDPCAEANLPTEVEKVHKLMREFDDYAALASNTPQAQLVQVVPELQRVLREAEDQDAPACLANLKTLQLKHMEIVVQTLLIFVSNGDVNVVTAGIARARELHAQYEIEMARLLGITLTVVTQAEAINATSTPEAQSTPPSPTAVP